MVAPTARALGDAGRGKRRAGHASPIQTATRQSYRLQGGRDRSRVASHRHGGRSGLHPVIGRVAERVIREAFRAAYSEGASCFAHSAARSLIRSNFKLAGLPFRTIVTLFRSSRGKIIAFATAEHNFMVP